MNKVQEAIKMIKEFRDLLNTIVNDGVNTDGDADILYSTDIENGRDLLNRTSNFENLLSEAEPVSTFNSRSTFSGPTEAVDLINQQADPIEALLAVVRANVEIGEFGFAADVIRDFGLQ